MGLTTKVLLNKVRKKQDGTYPLVIRVTYNSKVIYIPLGLTLQEQDWNARAQEIKPNCKIISNTTRVNNEIRSKVARVYEVFTELESSGEINSLTMKEFKSRIVKTDSEKEESVSPDFFEFIEKQINALKKAGNTGNASVYKNLQGRLQTYVESEELKFEEITYSFLLDFERSFKAGGGTTGGLSVYMRTLRAVYNHAIKSGIVSEESYPFKNYSIKNSKSVPKALNQEQFDKFKAVDLSKFPHYERTRDLFMASFYMRGMNWMDMAFLEKKNITGSNEEQRLFYTRRKTSQNFNMKISKPLSEIFDKYKSSKSDFLLPIIQEAKDPKKYPDVIRNKRLRLNKYLKKIADIAEIPHFSIYAARHTYATTGKRRGVPTAIIQQQMGHATESMTQTYLDSFENNVLDQYDDITLA